MQEFSSSTPKHKLIRCSKEYPNPLLLRDKMQHLFVTWSLKSQLLISFSKDLRHLSTWPTLAHSSSLKDLSSLVPPAHTLFFKGKFSTWHWGVTSKVHSSAKHCLTSQQISFQISPSALFILNYLDLLTGFLFISLHYPNCSSTFHSSQRKNFICLVITPHLQYGKFIQHCRTE